MYFLEKASIIIGLATGTISTSSYITFVGYSYGTLLSILSFIYLIRSLPIDKSANLFLAKTIVNKANKITIMTTKPRATPPNIEIKLYMFIIS